MIVGQLGTFEYCTRHSPPGCQQLIDEKKTRFPYILAMFSYIFLAILLSAHHGAENSKLVLMTLY